MRYLTFCFLSVLIITSCEEDNPVPDEFTLILGKWKAYEYTECFNAGTPQDYCVNYPVDGVNVEYRLNVKRGKIELYQAHTLCTEFIVKDIDLVIPDSVYINYLFTGRIFPFIEKQHFLIVFNRSTDELVVQSGYSENNAPANLYLTSYKMIREN